MCIRDRDYQNGWDTDQFPNNIQETTEAMLVFLKAGGLQGGGINFDAKIRRNSTDLADVFHAHIGGADTFARGLLIADKIINSSPYDKGWIVKVEMSEISELDNLLSAEEYKNLIS